MTTPLERDILHHYWVYPGPYPRETPLITQLINKFVAQGFLTRHPATGEIDGNDEALSVYMAALGSVPLPVMKWVRPE